MLCIIIIYFLTFMFDKQSYSVTSIWSWGNKFTDVSLNQRLNCCVWQIWCKQGVNTPWCNTHDNCEYYVVQQPIMTLTIYVGIINCCTCIKAVEDQWKNRKKHELEKYENNVHVWPSIVNEHMIWDLATVSCPVYLEELSGLDNEVAETFQLSHIIQYTDS